MNKTELVNVISAKANISKVDAKKSLDAFMETIGDTLVSGDKVVLPGFGSFSVVKKAERPGRNPRTGALIMIPAKNAVKFSPGSELAEKINN